MTGSRSASVQRHTNETRITAELDIDGTGRYQVHTGIQFLDHMLELFARHGAFDLALRAEGDLDVDQHHTVEDCGIVLGQAFAEALGDKVGIRRSGYFLMPMDEALAVAAVDLSGRPALVYHALARFRMVGDLQVELLDDFFDGFTVHCGTSLHLRLLSGHSSHQRTEALVKCWAKAMRFACSQDERLKDQLPSTKGLLEKGRGKGRRFLT